MPAKVFEIDGIGSIEVTKRRSSRNIRLSIGSRGEIHVSIPSWTSYQSGVAFAQSKADWIQRNVPEKAPLLQPRQRIGKAHRLVFASADISVPSARLSGGDIRITRPTGMLISHPEVQKAAEKACIRALRAEAAALLPKRLRALADSFEFSYNKVSIKQLKGRWGSCDNNQDIVLNLFLMQLPWPLIDYVLIHELVHTKHMNHGEGFWREFLRHEPLAKRLRSRVKTHRPVLMAVQPETVA